MEPASFRKSERISSIEDPCLQEEIGIRTEKVCVPPTSPQWSGRIIEVSLRHLEPGRQGRPASQNAKTMLRFQEPCDVFFSLKRSHGDSELKSHAVTHSLREDKDLCVLFQSVNILDPRLGSILRQKGPITGKLLYYLSAPLKQGSGFKAFKERYEVLERDYKKLGISDDQWTNIKKRLVLHTFHNPKIRENKEYLALIDVDWKSVSTEDLFYDFMKKNPEASLQQIAQEFSSLRIAGMVSSKDFERMVDQVCDLPNYQEASPKERKAFWNQLFLDSAACGGTSDMLGYLLHHGADVNALDVDGNNALHLLLSNPQRAKGPDYSLQFLLKQEKLDIQHLNRRYLRPIDLAVRNKNEADVEMILRSLFLRYGQHRDSLRELFLLAIGHGIEDLSPLTCFNNALFLKDKVHIFEAIGYSHKEILKQTWEIPVSS
jgi:hypothetical protein